MWRRLLLPVLASLAVTAVVAGAQSSSPYALPPEPAVSASAALRMPSAKRCVRAKTVRVTVLPPARIAFASLSVRVGADEILQLASLAGPASLKVTLRPNRSRVMISGTTAGGQFVEAARTYRRCRATTPRPARPRPVARKPAPKPRPQTDGIRGGGED